MMQCAIAAVTHRGSFLHDRLPAASMHDAGCPALLPCCLVAAAWLQEGAFLALGKDPKAVGETVFRYDDTNPEKEDDVYIR